MKKKYEQPRVNVRLVTAREIIVTSDLYGGEDISDTSADAPRRDTDWSEYYH
jgi:hypothetical protein